MELQINDRAPDFELVGQDGKTYRLADFRGQPVVLVFYPQDFSGVCTEELACVADAMPRFGKLEAQVIGVSVDSKYSHAAFAKQHNIPYLLLADFHPKAAVGRMYGVYMDDIGYHRRWTFVIDPEGRISFIQKNETGEVPDLEEVVAAVEDAL